MDRDANLDAQVPSSSPDLVRNFQAAFKRHRSIASASMPANNLLPKRAILPKRGTSKPPSEMKYEDEESPQSEQNSKPEPNKNVQLEGADPAILSSHMASLAVTENDPKSKNPELHHFITSQTCASSVTTTLINSSSAPVSNSTTHCSTKDVPPTDNPPPVKQLPKNTEKPSRKRGYDPDLFFKVNGKLYQKLGKIGSGGSSEVHKVISSECNIYALKKIKLKGRDYGTAYDFCQEIEYLNRLKGRKNIIQLIDYEVTDASLLTGRIENKDERVRDDAFIFMVLEYGEIDLAHMLLQKRRETEESGSPIDENWLRFYWQQILEAVNTIHEERIVHSDLKPANFLLVKGALKLIDFGIAKSISSDTTNIQRDSQVGTLSYMSPEAFLCNERDADGNLIKCGRGSDIWSLGCILYQMVYGRTPFADHKVFWAKVKIITDPNHQVEYGAVSNPLLVDLMKKCLVWDRTKRWRIPQLLSHPFLSPHVTRQPGPALVECWDLMEELIANPCCDEFSERKRLLVQKLKVCLDSAGGCF